MLYSHRYDRGTEALDSSLPPPRLVCWIQRFHELAGDDGQESGNVPGTRQLLEPNHFLPDCVPRGRWACLTGTCRTQRCRKRSRAPSLKSARAPTNRVHRHPATLCLLHPARGWCGRRHRGRVPARIPCGYRSHHVQGQHAHLYLYLPQVWPCQFMQVNDCDIFRSGQWFCLVLRK